MQVDYGYILLDYTAMRQTNRFGFMMIILLLLLLFLLLFLLKDQYIQAMCKVCSFMWYLHVMCGHSCKRCGKETVVTGGAADFCWICYSLLM